MDHTSIENVGRKYENIGDKGRSTKCLSGGRVNDLHIVRGLARDTKVGEAKEGIANTL
jgi:hypothetical protein